MQCWPLGTIAYIAVNLSVFIFLIKLNVFELGWVLNWDAETQPNCRSVVGATSSRPDLVLIGHKDKAEFALALYATEPSFCALWRLKRLTVLIFCVDWNQNNINLIVTG
ncbi:Hypothetical predicted protein [Olea europaea subsp. europaea]|uniref:Uncharacterized protein n=1 Tax=Olea europaea subsp. europaea TaxID=158383 RepID=A0A8S0P7G5_OLEEU|nr:Hypothetical predicted protein [Olea europaea subsp. europaea]